jgi:hypothetical protein
MAGLTGSSGSLDVGAIAIVAAHAPNSSLMPTNYSPVPVSEFGSVALDGLHIEIRRSTTIHSMGRGVMLVAQLATGQDHDMAQHGLYYTENDIEKFRDNRRFLAAAHAYSLDIIPLGEAIVRAAETKPYYPKTLEILGYVQLFHEMAERISDGTVHVPDSLQQEFRQTYDATGHKDPVAVRFFSARDFMKFSELRRPEVKQKTLDLFRREYDEADISELIKNKKLLAATDAYGKGLISLQQLKESVFGDFNANPRDLSFFAFKDLTFELVRRIQSGRIQIPRNLEEEFKDVYHPPPLG